MTSPCVWPDDRHAYLFVVGGNVWSPGMVCSCAFGLEGSFIILIFVCHPFRGQDLSTQLDLLLYVLCCCQAFVLLSKVWLPILVDPLQSDPLQWRTRCVFCLYGVGFCMAPQWGRRQHERSQVMFCSWLCCASAGRKAQRHDSDRLCLSVRALSGLTRTAGRSCSGKLIGHTPSFAFGVPLV